VSPLSAVPPTPKNSTTVAVQHCSAEGRDPRTGFRHFVTLHDPMAVLMRRMLSAWRQLPPSCISRTLPQPAAASCRFQLQTPLSLIARVPTRRPFSSSPLPPPPNRKNQIKLWPFLVIIALGSGSYILLVNKRTGMFFLLRHFAAACPPPFPLLSLSELSSAELRSDTPKTLNS
jgi:hypothetical protein